MDIKEKTTLVYSMFRNFGFISFFKLLFFAVLRKLKINSKNVIVVKIYVKKINNCVFIRPYCTDYTLLLDFFAKETHEKGGHYEFCEIGKDINFILDGGANIGFFSVLYAKKYPQAKIVCVEPELSNYKLMKKNISRYPNIIGVQGGIWSCDTGLRIINPEYHNVGFRVDELDINDERSEIRGYAVETLMAMHGVDTIDIFKMDIEGSEFNVILDAKSDNWLKKTNFLIMEIHDTYMPGGRQSIYEKMKGCGFKFLPYGEDNLFIKEQR